MGKYEVEQERRQETVAEASSWPLLNLVSEDQRAISMMLLDEKKLIEGGIFWFGSTLKISSTLHEDYEAGKRCCKLQLAKEKYCSFQWWEYSLHAIRP